MNASLQDFDATAVARWRRDTPGCATNIHLNNAGAALQPRPVLDAITAYQEREAWLGGYETEDQAAAEIAAVYTAVGELVTAAPRNIALVENATVAFAQALSAIPFQAGDVILTTRADYVSNQVMFLALAERLGVRVVHAPDLPREAGGGVDVAAFGELLAQYRPRLAAVTHVPTYSGRIQNVAAIGALCSETETLYLVDACQSVGQFPLDVTALGCDFLSATSRKFLRGPRGMGFLYAADRVLEAGLTPLLPDLRGAEWLAPNRFRPVGSAQRFENWEFNYALVLGLGTAARYALEIGLDTIARRNARLTAHARTRLRAIPGVELVDREGIPGETLAAIITAVLPGQPDAAHTIEALRRRGIHTSASQRSNAVIEYDDRGIAWALRVSPHYYNTTEEIDALVNTLGELLQ